MEFPAWYQSSQGPQISQTVINNLLAFLPMINFALASRNINILPADVNFWVTLGVFCFFSVRSLIGYVNSKRALQEQVRALSSQVIGLGVKPNV